MTVLSTSEAAIRRMAAEGADEIITMVRTGADTATIARHLGFQQRVVNRVAVTFLTEAGWPAWRIAQQLGINPRNVKRQRATARARSQVRIEVAA